MIEIRIYMGVRYIFFTFGIHSWEIKETWIYVDQISIGTKL